VTPRVNAGGRVTMELRQEVTDRGSDVEVGRGITNPTFLQRNFQSVVTVQSGESVVLGGLIRDSDRRSTNGVPFLQNLPIIGSLFSGRNRERLRTELIVLMTPSVVRNQDEARLVTNELRQKMKNASGIVEKELQRENRTLPVKITDFEMSPTSDNSDEEVTTEEARKPMPVEVKGLNIVPTAKSKEREP